MNDLNLRTTVEKWLEGRDFAAIHKFIQDHPHIEDSAPNRHEIGAIIKSKGFVRGYVRRTKAGW